MEDVSIICPWCNEDMPLNGGEATQTCPHCRAAVDVQAQLCYLRGCDSFAAAAEHAPQRRKKPAAQDYVSVEIEYYLQAYTGLQEALQGGLSPRQRRSAIATMADISSVFAGRMMVSTLEASYWQKQAIELNTRKELQELQENLAQPGPTGVSAPLQRSLWRLRSRQLTSALLKLEKQIEVLEQSIDFTYRRTGDDVA